MTRADTEDRGMPTQPLDAAPDAGSAVGAEIWWSGLFGHARRRLGLLMVQVGGTAAVAALSALAAYVMAYGWPPSMQPYQRTLFNTLPGLIRLATAPEYRPFLPLLLTAAALHPLILHGLGLYAKSTGRIVPFGGVWTVAKGVALATGLFAISGVVYGASPEGAGSPYSLLFLAYFGLLSLYGIVVFHAGSLIALLFLQSFGIGLRRVALVVGPETPPGLVPALTDPSSDYRLVGRVAAGDAVPDDRAPDTPRLGALEDLAAVINDHELDEVVLAVDPSTLSPEQRMEAAQTCWRLGVGLKMVPPFYPFFHTSGTAERLGDLSLLQVERVGLYARWPQVMKRTMDIAVSVLALAVSAPVLLAAMVAVKLDSPGPVFFVQKRVGLNGRAFRMLKLRSMRNDADPRIHQEYLRQLMKEGVANDVDKDGNPVYKIVNDPRITRVGRFIRRTSIDELPQLLNVLRGEMSLVGPRPPLPYEVAEYEPWHFRRLHIRPGITGLWQVSGRSQLTYEQMIRLDIQYVEQWSLWLDLRILLRTLPAVLKIAHSY